MSSNFTILIVWAVMAGLTFAVYTALTPKDKAMALQNAKATYDAETGKIDARKIAINTELKSLA